MGRKRLDNILLTLSLMHAKKGWIIIIDVYFIMGMRLFFAVTMIVPISLNMILQRQSRDSRVIVTQQSRDSHATVTRQSRDRRVLYYSSSLYVPLSGEMQFIDRKIVSCFACASPNKINKIFPDAVVGQSR